MPTTSTPVVQTVVVESFNHPKMWGDMPTRCQHRCASTRFSRSFNHPKMWGDMPTGFWSRTHIGSTWKFQSSEDVGGHADSSQACRNRSRRSLFQSSEDVGGHADFARHPRARLRIEPVSIIRRCGGTCRPFAYEGNMYNLSMVSIIRRCGGTCRQEEKMVFSTALSMFQSSEDVGGHADVKVFQPAP